MAKIFINKSKKEIKQSNSLVGEALLKNCRLKYYPVGIKFLKKGEEDFGLARAKKRKSICAFLKIATEGESFFIDKNSISCPGGLKWMGFTSRLTETYFYKYFLGKVEKIKSSPKITGKFLDLLPLPPKKNLYEKLLFASFKNCPFEPDVVVLIANPRDTYQIIAAAYLEEHYLVKTIPICAPCHGVVSIPFVTGELNTSMIDPMCRQLGAYKDDEILIGMPYLRFNSFVDNFKKTHKNFSKMLLIKIIKKFID